MSNRDGKLTSRRSIMRSTGALAVGTTLLSSGVAAQQTSSVEAAKKEAPNVSTQTIQSNNDYVIDRITIDRETFIVTTHTDGKKEGKVEYIKVSSERRRQADTESPEVEISEDELKNEDEIVNKSSVIIERSSQIGGLLDEDCEYDFCDGYKYEHRYNGFTFELTDDANDLKGAGLAAALLGLVRNLTKLTLQSWLVSALVGIMINNITGTVFTYIGKDYDGFFGPELQHCAAGGWDKDVDDVQQFLLDTTHVGSYYDSRCEY